MSKDQIIAKKEAENIALKAENAYLRRMIFAAKSERFEIEDTANQLNLFGQDSQGQEEKQTTSSETITYERSKKKHPGRNKLPDHLPVEEIVLEPEQDTQGLKRIGEEISESIKFTPASLVILRLIRPKYEKKDQQGVIIAPLPNRPIHKGIAESSLLSHILVCKFVDHLPFYRQIKRFKRDFDWIVSSSTINDWFAGCCTLLKPVYDEMVHQIQKSNYIQADESPIKVLESEKKKQTHQGYQWVYHCPKSKTIVFNYRKGRGMQGPKEFLAGYQGYLQCDGYKVYDKIGSRDGIHLVGCLAHARRYFYDALDNDKKRASEAMEVFKEIYAAEREWKECSEEQRYEKRQNFTKEKLEWLKEWCETESIRVEPKSRLGKAMRYYQKQYDKLIAVISHAQLELDNNLIENKIRPLALGRKNYLFAGSHDAGQRIAMMYSFFATCKAKQINPQEWLEKTLTTLADPHFNKYDTLVP